MANSNYVGRYGETLRRLTALERGTPQGFGTPLAAPTGVFPSAPPPTTGAFSAVPSASQSNAGTDEASSPVSAGQLWKDMPDQFKQQIHDQVTSTGMNVDDTFRQKVDAGEIPPPKKEMTRDEKLGYLAEIALHTLSNLSRPGTESISDFADAKLGVDARRGAIETAETDRRLKQNETRRVEGRQDAAEQRRLAGDLTERELTRESIANEGAAGRKNALGIAAMQERSRKEDRAAARQDRAATPGPVLTGEDGTMYNRNPDGTATAITTEVDVPAEGSPYRPGATRKEKRPLKGTPKQRFNEVDQDNLLREQGKEAATLRKDEGLQRQLKKDLASGKIASIDDEIERRAKEKVMRRLALASGSAKSPAASGNFFDQADE